jgi:hypothetical protein
MRQPIIHPGDADASFEDHEFVIRFADGRWHAGDGRAVDKLREAIVYETSTELNVDLARLRRAKPYQGPCDCGCMDMVATTSFGMLNFLKRRMEGAGVSDTVGQGYARDIGFILERERRMLLNLPTNRLKDKS